MKKTALLVIPALIFLSQGCCKKSSIESRVNAWSGTVTINGKAVTAKDIPVSYGDRIETGDNSFCDIMVGEKNIFRLGKESSLVFNVSDSSSVLMLEKGWFSGVTRKIFTRQAKYQIKTPTVTASIRGTSYCVKVEDPGNTYFCVCNGSIALAGDKGESSEEVTASHHAARRFTRDDKGALAINKDPGLLYHDDSGVETLAAMINEKVDWSHPDSK